LEKVDGLPQMKIEYDRGKIAKFGLNISDLNEIVTMGFAGMTAGKVFEGERQFDLVVRFAEPFRKDISNLEQASIQLPNGGSVPLSELAKISYTKGPAKISRDNTNRRIVIGVNVRNRDLQSVVDDIQSIVANQIDLPEGYRVAYGGQFENLQKARNRLMIAVPIALFLIFVLLYFAFSSTQDALMIYSAIPLSAIGGILLLWARDMPFSISAGVGFIALFGIAVLNGIVLIEHFKSMESHYTNIKDLVITGAKERLRPVLLTASAAALGFLPMAISNSAGAEVQRPLATVVVGGLITATFLTLIVLPVLYVLFKTKSGSSSPSKKILTSVVLISMFSFAVKAQETPLTLEQAIEIGMERNLNLQAADKSLEMANVSIGQGWNLDKANVYYSEDKNDIAENGVFNRKIGLSQSFAFPSLYGAQKNALEAGAEMQLSQFELQKRKLQGEISKGYIEVRYWQELIENYEYLDSLYAEFSRAATRKFETGESNYLEKLTAEGKRQEIGLKKSESNENYLMALDQLKLILNWEGDLELSRAEIALDISLEQDWSTHPGVEYYESAVSQSGFQIQTEKRKLLPDINLDVFRGTNPGANAKIYSGFHAGITLPLFFGAQKSHVKSSEFQQQKIQLEAEQYINQLESRAQQLHRQLDQNIRVINYYEAEGKTLSLQILEQAQRSYQEGEIDFLQYVQLMENSRTITLHYLQSKFAYQQTILDINYLLN